MEMQQSKAVLSRNALKLLAVTCMLLDHIAWYFLPFSSPTAQVFHTLGRLTAPVMCFFLAQGVQYTKNIRRYLLRLFVFAMLAQAPWWYLHRDSKFSLNFLFTLFFCLLMLHIDATVASPLPRLCGIALCIAATYYCDWAFYAPAWCLIFYHCSNDRRKETLLFCLTAGVYFGESFVTKGAAGFSERMALLSSLFTLGVLLALPLVRLPLNNSRPSRFWKWFFYAFYPAHLGVIAIIKMIAR